MPLLMVSLGLLIAGVGILGAVGGLDAGTLRWLGMTSADDPTVRQVGVHRILFRVVAVSGLVLAAGGLLDLPAI